MSGFAPATPSVHAYLGKTSRSGRGEAPAPGQAAAGSFTHCGRRRVVPEPTAPPAGSRAVSPPRAEPSVHGHRGPAPSPHPPTWTLPGSYFDK
nr:uncharacterized protein LOC131273234 isoform X4 [Dasypus novemcinctus]XP_058131479.1 uncharacterized protein LOC131273237 isoform X2 [Dasypus novemcinctus]